MVKDVQSESLPGNGNNTGYFHLISGLRGIALLNMLLFHFCYDIYVIFGLDPEWYLRLWVHVWQQYICISFLLLSGISWHFGHHNVKKGLLLNLYGFLITAVTLIFIPSQVIWFGVLNGIGCATLLLCLLDKMVSWFERRVQAGLKKHSEIWGSYAFLPEGILGVIFSLLLFLLTYHLTDGYLGFGSSRILSIPEQLYQPRIMTILGLPYPGFYSSDYFPILPWSFLVMAGYWFWKLVEPFEKLLALFRLRIPFFSKFGRHTIWIYLLHQPILYAAAYLISYFLPIP